MLKGEIGGRSGSLFFDSGARMTMFFDRAIAAAAEPTRSYREWEAMLHKYEELQVFPLELAFDNGFCRSCEGALVTDARYAEIARAANIQAMLGIDIFEQYDLFFAVKAERRGIALLEKEGNKEQ